MPAVRSPAVMSWTDVSTHPTHEALGAPLEAGLADEGEGPPDSTAASTSEGWEPQGPAPRSPMDRALRGVGFHLAVIAGFTLPAVALWWHVWSGHPASSSHMRLRRSGAAGVVHRMAGVGHGQSAQSVLHRRGERAERREPALQHVGAPRRRAPRTSDVVVRTGRLHQRRPDAGTRPERVGMFRRHPPAGHVEAHRDPRRADLRILGGHRLLAGLRSRLGDGAGDPAAGVHRPARDRHHAGPHRPARRARAGRVAHRAVLHFARDLRHLAPLRRGRSGRGDGGGLAPSRSPGGPRGCPLWVWPPDWSSSSSPIRPGTGSPVPRLSPACSSPSRP